MKPAEPQPEHEWLQKLVGAWTLESQEMADSCPPPGAWTENGRSLGGLWVLLEGQGEMPGGSPGSTLMTLGYDPQKGRYVGSWVGSMMTYLWVYDGAREGNVLTLDSEGPSLDGDGKMARYRDVVELVSDDLRTLTSHVLGEDGEWQKFMTARYRRT